MAIIMPRTINQVDQLPCGRDNKANQRFASLELSTFNQPHLCCTYTLIISQSRAAHKQKQEILISFTKWLMFTR